MFIPGGQNHEPLGHQLFGWHERPLDPGPDQRPLNFFKNAGSFFSEKMNFSEGFLLNGRISQAPKNMFNDFLCFFSKDIFWDVFLNFRGIFFFEIRFGGESTKMLDFVKYPHDRTMKNIAIDCTFPSLPETNVAPENDGSSTTFLLGWPISRG